MSPADQNLLNLAVAYAPALTHETVEHLRWLASTAEDPEHLPLASVKHLTTARPATYRRAA